MLKASNQLMINLNKLWIKRNTWSVVQFLLPTRTEIESYNIEFGKSQIDEILCNKQEIWKEHECFDSNWKNNSPTQISKLYLFPWLKNKHLSSKTMTKYPKSSLHFSPLKQEFWPCDQSRKS